MEMRQYLIDTFRFNDRVNRKVLAKIGQLPDQAAAIRFFSHLINSQNKWLARILEYPRDPKLDWWDPVYPVDRLEEEWTRSLQAWIDFLGRKDEADLAADVKFIGYDGGEWAAQLKDIALQLNYHSIHHRAQIQTLIRTQGLKPDFVDYIGTVYRKLG